GPTALQDHRSSTRVTSAPKQGGNNAGVTMTRAHTERGSPLIELMIVVAIIGILASLAIPAYMEYTVRAKVSEIVLLARRDTDRLREYFHLYGTIPGDMAEIGLLT